MKVNQSSWFSSIKMRQLPGKAKKENRQMKRERKKDNLHGKQSALKIAVPVLVGLFGLLVFYVYTATSRHWNDVEPINLDFLLYIKKKQWKLIIYLYTVDSETNKSGLTQRRSNKEFSIATRYGAKDWKLLNLFLKNTRK